MADSAAGFARIALVGDSYGLPMTLAHVERSRVVCLVAASARAADLSHVRNLGARHDLPVLVQPRFQSPEYVEFVQAFDALSPELVLCNSYSMVLRPDILTCVAGKAVNLHAALLPRNRGPNPIQWALIHGERETGVTLHYMSDRVDAGDIIAQERISISDEDTWVTLRDRLDPVMRQLLAQELPRLLAGSGKRSPQDDSCATTNTRLTPESPRIDFVRMTDRQIFDLIRAQVRPLRGAYVEATAGRIFFPDWVSMSAVASLRARYA